MNENEIIMRLMSGDITALEAVYNEFADRLYSFSLTICKSKQTAEDVISDSFLKLYHYLSSGGQIQNLKSYLFTMVRNNTYDKLKTAARTESLPEDDIFVSNNLDVSEKAAITLALEKLPKDEREIVTLYCYGNFLHKEIANILGMPEGTVRWKYRKALSKLKSLLGGDEND